MKHERAPEASSAADGVTAVVLAGASLVGSFLVYGFFVPDDAFVYLRFATNLIERGELAFNPGEPAYGFTSALWLLLIGAGGVVTGAPLAAAKALSALFYAAGPPLVFAVVRRWTGDRLVGVLAAVAWALDAWALRWSWSGLEAGLSTALVLLVVFGRARDNDAGKVALSTSLAAALAPLVRPEAIGLTLLYLAHVAWTVRGPASRRLALFGRALAPIALVCGSAAAAVYAHFGRVLPNAGEAKGTLVPMAEGIVPATLRIGRIIASTAAIEAVVLGVALVILVLARRQVLAEGLSRDRGARGLAAAWVVGLIALHAARDASVHTRDLLAVTPLVVAGGFAALTVLAPPGRRRRLLATAMLAVAVVQNAGLTAFVVRPATVTYQESVERAPITLGEWLHDNAAPDDVIAAYDIGAIGVHSERRILNLDALVSTALDDEQREGRIFEVLEADPPEWIVDVHPDPRRMERVVPGLRLEMVRSEPFEKMFVLQDEPIYYSLWRVEGRAEHGEEP